MRKSEVMFDAITGIREELIEEALDHRFRRKNLQVQRWLSAVACLALMVTASVGAIRLGIIDGFGGSGKNNSKADCAAPESADQNSFLADDAYAEDIPAEEPAATPPADQPAEGTANEPAEDSGAAMNTFRGKVLEVGDGYLLIEPDDGSWIRSSADLIEVPVEDTDGFAPDISVTVTFSGGIQETYPARITDVVSVTASEK